MEIDERGKKLKLWVRRKKTGLKLICSGCGQHVAADRIHEVCEREVRDLPCFEYTTTVEMVLDRNLRFDENELDFREKPARNDFVGQALPPAHPQY